MIGAILGDIVGSRFEFDRGDHNKDFEFITDYSEFTDDSVMTIALADALVSYRDEKDENEIKKNIINSMQYWGNKYPFAGYGARFIYWLQEKDPKPYGSYGNGSAMRVSSVGWLYDSLEETRKMARLSAEISHNHKEGMKGAECTAAVIYLARTGKDKAEIKRYIDKEFGYDYSESLDQMRLRHKHEESCMDSLPKALRSFFDGTNYEDVVRNAVSLGGDTDTIGAIATAICGAMNPISDQRIIDILQNVNGIDFEELAHKEESFIK